MGFTLRAALECFTEDTRIVVAELVPEIIAWAHGPLAPVFQNCLADPRVSVRHANVGSLIAASRSDYDAILLDVDNGPDGLSRPQNDQLYGMAGLLKVRARAGGRGARHVIWVAKKTEKT